MNIQELKIYLHENNIPSELYNLDGIGRKDERFCIELIGNDWVVYFAERGTRTTEEKFNTEDDACKYLIKHLID